MWSCYGSPDPLAVKALQAAAERSRSTPRGSTSPSTLKRWQNAIAVDIWSRFARMTQRCLRPLADPEHSFENNREAGDESSDVLYGDWWDCNPSETAETPPPGL